MIATQDVSSATSPVPRGVRRALDAMRSISAAIGAWPNSLPSPALPPDLAAPVPHLCRQDPARRASRDRARMRAPRIAAGDARRQDHGCGPALRLPAFWTVLDRVSPPLRRDTVANTDAAGGLYGLARRDVRAAGADTRPARDGVRADRGGGGKSRDGCRSGRRTHGRTDPRRDFGRHGRGRPAIS